MAGNSTPIYSRVADIQGGVFINAAAADYTGQNINNQCVFVSDTTNGGFIQRLRFKAGTPSNSDAKVARIYINEGVTNLATTASTPGQPSGTPSNTGGTLVTGVTFFCKVQAIDMYGAPTALGTESASVSIASGSTGSIAWTWTAAAGAASYRVWVGPVTGGQIAYFTTNTNSFTQTAAYVAGQLGSPNDFTTTSMLYGELSLPVTTAITTTATVEIDYPMNFALPPGYRILVGFGAFTAGGWYVTAIGGKY